MVGYPVISPPSTSANGILTSPLNVSAYQNFSHCVTLKTSSSDVAPVFQYTVNFFIHHPPLVRYVAQF